MQPSEQITAYIEGFEDWRGETLRRLRTLILEVDPDLTEEWKWKSPVWSRDGMVVSIGGFKKHVSVNFFQGASLEDPSGLFEEGQDAKAMRSIRLLPDHSLDEAAFKDLVRTAIAHNAGK
ncbi:MAG: DUF1801 domain-containing protein [Dehalococcoidia bacterium]|nr:DUF1801 domain-containing protein [Dehalococcoidia bacterium]